MNDLLVLCYHGISGTWPEDTSVAPQDFERQLTALVRRGYGGVTLSEALARSAEGRRLVVSFDDANRSVAELAAPVMDSLGLPGTVFVPTDYPGSGRPMGWDGFDPWLGTEHEDELACMSWDELRELTGRGWEVGSHTCSHPRLSELDDAEIERELVESRAVCERELGVPCRTMAYPYSDYDERVVAATDRAGYDFAVTVPRGPAPAFPLEWPRVGVYRGNSARRVLVRARLRRLVPSAPARLAGALRRLAG